MDDPAKKRLIERLRNPEDSLVERKPDGADRRELRKTIVGFANSTPEDRAAVLFVGVGDDGKPLGLGNIESAQRKISRLCDECYPAFDPWPLFTSLVVDDKEILTVEVRRSKNKPHFAGAAFVRDGSKTVKASQRLFEEMLTSHCDKADTILKLKGEIVTIEHIGVRLGEHTFEPGYRTRPECQIITCTPHFVEFEWNHGRYSAPLAWVSIASDPERHRRYKLVVMHPRA